MKVLGDLLQSDVGILSALSILGVIVIGAFMYFWVRAKIREETQSQ